MGVDTPSLQAERDAGVLRLTIDRPRAANAIHPPLAEALGKLLRDPQAQAVLLTGTGSRAFCSGIDLRYNSDLLSPATLAMERASSLWECLTALMDCPVPVVCHVQTVAVGAGAMVALMCDRVVCERGASFVFPEVSVGMPSLLGLEVVASLSNWAVAADWVNTGRTVPAEEAYRHGLVHMLHEPGNAKAALQDQIAQITAGEPQALRSNRRWINAVRRCQLERAWAQVCHDLGQQQ